MVIFAESHFTQTPHKTLKNKKMDQQAKQQVIERIKSAENILVTVSTDPTVDQLAACIGTALMINRMDKRGTAIYSGKTPSTIEFLQPEKTIETNTDSLRDFIISLDKNKADKLRYKVEDKVVRIYITPYRTSIGEKDLQFTMGDYNVDLVLALGVKDKMHIDQVITAHGRILHDAPVISLNTGQAKSPDVGQINWQDTTASSLCEMMVSISEALGTGLIDNQIATAFLTGIVAETERFSNSKTTSKVMTMSAQLMAAGANQQLIATKLAPPPPEPPPAAKAVPAPKKPTPPPPKDSGEITIDHGDGKKKKGVDEVKLSPNEILIDDKGNIEKAQELLRQAQERQNAANAAAVSQLPKAMARSDSSEAAVAASTSMPGTNSPIKTFRHEGDHDMFNLPKSGQSAPFSAVGSNEEAWYDPMNADKNLAPDAAEPNGGFISKGHDITPGLSGQTQQPANPMSAASAPAQPAPASPPTDLNNARDAVQSALSTAPYDASHPEPIAALNSQPMADLHPPQPQPAQPAPAAPAAPPPVPPPLQLGSVPVEPAPSGAKQNNQGAAPVDPNSPNSAWPL